MFFRADLVPGPEGLAYLLSGGLDLGPRGRDQEDGTALPGGVDISGRGLLVEVAVRRTNYSLFTIHFSGQRFSQRRLKMVIERGPY